MTQVPQPNASAPATEPSARRTLITDFDNTLYDWFRMWHESFGAMLAETVRLSGVPEADLLPEIRAIHQKNRTSEYAFILEELPSVQRAFAGQDIRRELDSAIHAYRSARKRSLFLYDGVAETLTELRRRGVLIVIYTESLGFYTNYRIQRLELDGLVDFVFSPPDHDMPVGSNGTALGAALSHAQHKFLPDGVIKPNPDVLLDIVEMVGRTPSDCIYLGDSLMKDVAMAQDAGIVDVLATYGAVQYHAGYDLLRKVSHWTQADVERERAGSPRLATHKVSKFADILQFFPKSEPNVF